MTERYNKAEVKMEYRSTSATILLICLAALLIFSFIPGKTIFNSEGITYAYRLLFDLCATLFLALVFFTFDLISIISLRINLESELELKDFHP